jgi:hypothetical protein
MNIGGLYSYWAATSIYTESNDYLEPIAITNPNEPFVLLEMKPAHEWGQYLKILTIDGILGWIFIGNLSQIKNIA